MRSLFTFLLVFLTVQIAIGQNEEKKPVILKLNIPSLGDETTFPTLRFSAEKKVGKKTSLAIEAGYQIYTIERFADTNHIQPRGIKLDAELRYYPKHKSISDMTGFYLSANPFFRRNKYTERLSYYPKTEQRPNYKEMTEDYFIVKKSISGVHFIVGGQFNLRVPFNSLKPKVALPRIFIDGSLGVGAFYRHVENEHREFNEDQFKRYKSRHPNFNDAITRSGLSENSGVRPGFAFNLRFGYRL